MSTNTFLFPDVNVWLALAHGRHPHNETATQWIDALGPEYVLHFCRFTQLGLLRLLTTGSAMGIDVMTQAAAWELYDLFFHDGRIGYVEEPKPIETGFRAKTSRQEASAKQWADGYLAAFAESSGLQLVTFDRALAKQSPGSLLLTP